MARSNGFVVSSSTIDSSDARRWLGGSSPRSCTGIVTSSDDCIRCVIASSLKVVLNAEWRPMTTLSAFVMEAAETGPHRCRMKH